MVLLRRANFKWYVSALLMLSMPLSGAEISDSSNQIASSQSQTTPSNSSPTSSGASPTKPSIATLQAEANAGDPAAMYQLGAAYDYGNGVDQDIEQAMDLYEKAAEKGNAQAEFALGFNYWQGRGLVVPDGKKSPFGDKPVFGRWQQVVQPDGKQAVKWFKKAADQGISGADWALGQCYFNGYGVDKNISLAVDYYRKAAELNDPLGQLAMGAVYGAGVGVEKDPAMATSYIQKAAAQGNAQAEYMLGWNLSNGFGIAADPAEGASWYKKAADQNDLDAKYALAMCYLDGVGVPADLSNGIKSLLALGQMNYVPAETTLGVLYEQGPGVDQDYSQAASWYRKAADAGNTEAQTDLGVLYANGKGVDRDLTEAVRWYWKAAQQGFARAEFLLYGAYYSGAGVTQDKGEAMKLLSEAANQGYADAETLMGVSYQYGNGVPMNGALAFDLYSKAAQQDDAMAEEDLASCYEFGIGTDQNIAEAFSWYKKSAMHGYYPGQCGLGFMYLKGKGVLKDEVEGMAWLYLAAANGNAYVADTLLPQYERAYGADAALAARKRAKELQDQISAPLQGNQAASGATTITDAPDTPRASGTGEFLTSDGYILTAAHVIHGAARIEILTATGKLTASVAKVDTTNDVALLKCSGTGFTPIPIAPSKDARIGETVFTLGFPNIQLQGFDPKLTKGEISSAGGFQDDPRSWQISVPIQPGNSGGPLCDQNGNLIGIVEATLDPLTMAKLAGEIPQNVNYAVKSSYILPLLDDVPNLPAPRVGSGTSFEDTVENVRPSAVLILVY